MKLTIKMDDRFGTLTWMKGDRMMKTQGRLSWLLVRAAMESVAGGKAMRVKVAGKDRRYKLALTEQDAMKIIMDAGMEHRVRRVHSDGQRKEQK